MKETLAIDDLITTRRYLEESASEKAIWRLKLSPERSEALRGVLLKLRLMIVRVRSDVLVGEISSLFARVFVDDLMFVSSASAFTMSRWVHYLN